MLKAILVRIYPTSAQVLSLAKAFGTVRWLWNNSLAFNNQAYKDTGKGVSYYDLKKRIVELKKEFPWLKETYSQVLQSTILNLSRAFKNFFERRAELPRFKSKRGKQSIQYPQHTKVEENKLYLPKIGWVKANFHRQIIGEVKTITVSCNKSGHYYASILTDDGVELPANCGGGNVTAVDLGLIDFAVTSDGRKFSNPRHLKKHEKNLARKQKKLSKKQKGSNNRYKARRLVARVHEKIANCRKDFLHKLSRLLVNESQVIAVENLNIKGMVRCSHLAKAIADSSWGMFCNFLKYKCNWAGKVYLEVDRFFPSSKTCYVCLNVVDSLPLDVRAWQCNRCKTRHDRDTTAAINIKNEAIRILTTSGTGESHAWGDGVRPVGGRPTVFLASVDEPGSYDRIACNQS
ncbi:MAG TPA: transposase [Cyanobacteria bacterium UBA11049]|nr:transposase [Cyanobacteria bacterium UBA11049]